MANLAPLRPRPSSPGFVHSGFVKFDEQMYPCDVTNMSETGATLHFKLPVELPEHFTLQLTFDGKVARECTVTWNEGVELGVTFDRGTND
jgi:hypothetical protein